MGEGAQQASKFFKNDATIILESCSTGKEGGIGQQLSEALGIKVIAPKEPTSIGRIKSNLDNDRVDFDVEYRGGTDYSTFDNGKQS
jgi:hypothetical protein